VTLLEGTGINGITILAEILPKRINNSTTNYCTHSCYQFNSISPSNTPTRVIKRKKANTVKKSRFFEVYDSRTRVKEPTQSLESLFDEHGLSKTTAHRWLRERQS
jgi:hypothetical protein